jgi:hypothetical protein
VPRRNPPQRIRARFRHPHGAPIARVEVNGRKWEDFYPDTQWVLLGPTTEPVHIVAHFEKWATVPVFPVLPDRFGAAERALACESSLSLWKRSKLPHSTCCSSVAVSRCAPGNPGALFFT